MTEGSQPDAGGRGFEAIDAKLNVFALANGMDLTRTDGSRRLSWFNDGRERGLRIEAVGSESYAVEAMAWHTKAPGDATSGTVTESVAQTELMATLEAAIEHANAL